MNKFIILTLAALAGCAGNAPVPTVEYIPVPEGYLLPCALPALPEANGGLSEAFAQAYACAEIGNNDKAAIRDLLGAQ